MVKVDTVGAQNLRLGNVDLPVVTSIGMPYESRM